MNPKKKMVARRKKMTSPTEYLDGQREREANNRRKLLASMNPEVGELAMREFAKLGLTQ